jgi:hypothetical protein
VVTSTRGVELRVAKGAYARSSLASPDNGGGQTESPLAMRCRDAWAERGQVCAAYALRLGAATAAPCRGQVSPESGRLAFGLWAAITSKSTIDVPPDDPALLWAKYLQPAITFHGRILNGPPLA